MTTTLSGIFPVLPTPFTKTGEIDLEAMPRVVEFAVESGVGGVVFPGFASEVEHLRSDERQALLGIVVEAVDGTVPIVAGASGETPMDVIGHGKSAQALGIDWLMIQPPKSIGSGADAAIAFFTEITAALSDVRIILQNAPAPRGSDFSPETILEIVRAVPQVVYVKEETLPAGPAITTILGNKPESLLGVIGGGGARYILDEYERGACAAMPAIEIADLHVELDKAWRKGNKATARDIYVRTLPLLTLQAVYRMRLTKHTMMRRGFMNSAIVRAPTADLDAFSTADIDANLTELGLLETDQSKRGVLA